jgi:hypothetical protein
MGGGTAGIVIEHDSGPYPLVDCRHQVFVFLTGDALEERVHLFPAVFQFSILLLIVPSLKPFDQGRY